MRRDRAKSPLSPRLYAMTYTLGCRLPCISTQIHHPTNHHNISESYYDIRTTYYVLTLHPTHGRSLRHTPPKSEEPVDLLQHC